MDDLHSGKGFKKLVDLNSQIVLLSTLLVHGYSVEYTTVKGSQAGNKALTRAGPRRTTSNGFKYMCFTFGGLPSLALFEHQHLKDPSEQG